MKVTDKKLGKYFLRELAKLTEETGLIISGCGCCQSPYLMDAIRDFKDGGFYKYDDDFDYIRWRENE